MVSFRLVRVEVKMDGAKYTTNLEENLLNAAKNCIQSYN